MSENKYYKKIYQNYKKNEKIKTLARDIGLKAFFLFLIGVFISLGIFVYHAKDLPRPEKFTERNFAEPTKIYDRAGEVVLYTIYG